MIWLVLGMMLAVILAVVVLGTVALPARRAGRPMFTERGEKLFRISDGESPSAAGSTERAAKDRAVKGGTGARGLRRSSRKG